MNADGPIPVGVRTLCDFAARSGDLDHRYTPAPSSEEGIAGHRRVVARRGPGYRGEVPLRGECGGLLLSGRADGYDGAANRLEEIKTHRGDLARIGPGQRALHRAQLRAYGALLCRAEGLATITLSLVYLDIQRERETPLTEEADAVTLWGELEALCGRYLAWAHQEQRHRRERDAALLTLRFPFPAFRAGQRDLAETTYKALMGGRDLLLQAPTGIGKTVGTLYPALMAMPRAPLDRIHYLTARNTGRQLALDGLALIRGANPEATVLRVLVLSAREQACEYPDRACHGESCPLARGFYDRLPVARAEALARGLILDPPTLRDLALAHQVCPYYLTQELARWADLVVADVNYQFDQQALLHGLAVQQDWRVALLVDEAHNLAGRARAMYSAELTQARLRAVRRQAPAPLKGPLEALARAWGRLLARHVPLQAGAGADTPVILDTVPRDLDRALQGLLGAITDYLTESPGDAALQELMFEGLGFLALAERFGDHSVCELARDGIGKGRLAIVNLIPADFLRPRFDACRGAVLFSATLAPAPFHRDLLGLPEDTPWQAVDSPFSAGQLQVRIVPAISTRLRDRGASLAPTVERIVRQFRTEPANYLVYLSSFAYLDGLYDAFSRAAPDIPAPRQLPAMSPEARQAFIDSFREGGRQVGFAVLGGAFAEGIDLPGSRLSGVFVLTLGLPPHDRRHELLRARLQQRFGQGYEYGYLYPGVQKVVQAAGRVIRTPEDTGVIELIDDRFARPGVRALLPAWWRATVVERE